MTPFGQLPLLTAPGSGVVMAQTVAIIRYIGHLGNMPGASFKGPTDASFITSEMLMCEAEDIYNLLQKSCPTLYVALGESGKGDRAAYDALWAEKMPQHLQHLEALCRHPLDEKVCGFSPPADMQKFGTPGELHLWANLHQARLVSPSMLDGFPKLAGWYDLVHGSPHTARVLGGESAIGHLDQYFVTA